MAANQPASDVPDDKASRNPAHFTRGRPFAPGNSGRPKGARNKRNVIAQALLEGEQEALVRKAIELALAGNVTALRLCLDRLAPAPRERAIDVDLPPITNSDDAVDAAGCVAPLVAAGELTLSEAKALHAILEERRAVLRSEELQGFRPAPRQRG